MLNDIEKIVLPADDIAQKVQTLGEQITKDYEGKDLLAVCTLKGCCVFFADLIRTIKLPLTIDFINLSSYGNAVDSSGQVKLTHDLSVDIADKNVLIVEDIIDSGNSLNFLLRELTKRRPASIKICTLLDKPERRQVEVPVDYNGFVVPDEFLVGYGLDYAEKYRNLPFIAILKRAVYA